MLHLDEHTSVRRSRDGVLAGVCAGLAKHFDVDAIVVRVAAILLAICTFGLAALLYIVLAFALPAEEKQQGVVDIGPAQVRSDRYSQVVGCAGEPRAASAQQLAACAGAAHVPPTPPADADCARASVVRAAPVEASSYPGAGRGRVVLAAVLLVCLCVLFALFCTLAMPYIPGEKRTVLDFAPVAAVALGVIVLVCFADSIKLVTRVLLLVLCAEVCVALLPFTLQLCPIESLYQIGDVSIALWFAAGASLMAALVYGKGDLLALVVLFAGLALVSTWGDMSLPQWIDAASSYSQHNPTSPLFRH